MELVKAMEPKEQTAVLLAANAVRGLADNGLARAVIDMVLTMKPREQVAVLSVPNAVQDLVSKAYKRQDRGLNELIRALKYERQSVVPSARKCRS
jgi:hypothetical protein